MGTFSSSSKHSPTASTTAAFILGNPWKSGPYGYCCSDGRRAFFCLNNCTWNDRVLSLQLNSAWGLPGGTGFQPVNEHGQDGRATSTWDLYRWYPKPAHCRPERCP